jgi:hypothetical protein
LAYDIDDNIIYLINPSTLNQNRLQNCISRISAQQTVAPDAVTRVFPSVGGYKEFAPTIS